MNSAGLGFLYLLASRIQLWERKTGFDAVARWVIGGTVELDTLLSLDSVKQIPPLILGFFENDNAQSVPAPEMHKSLVGPVSSIFYFLQIVETAVAFENLRKSRHKLRSHVKCEVLRGMEDVIAVR
ncbi:hypothetical protein PR202_gb23762 [Eleusine coracana subsp. coracana]|uniref:Uncharacterized protein n=1 Tax=Eleusine coracana subsp. coracana TaxID=191504 RepID=A0AAV5FKQ9_ELECO|nr:hypothetical protein PR202_gb23762 [Eleusine coracana subsp. coracana]